MGVASFNVSMLRYYADRQDVIAKPRLLKDCMSSVAHPEINYKLADDAFQKFAREGLTLVKSSDALD